MEEVLRIREAVVSAVCAKDYAILAGCIQRLAKVVPSEEILLESGIGHLLSDRHLWGLAGHIVQRRAAALQARWRLHVRRARAGGLCVSGKRPTKPLAGLGAKAFLTLVQEFKEHAASTVPGADGALCRAVAVKAVLLGFSSCSQLAGTEEEDIIDMMPSPAARAVFMQMVARAAGLREATAKRKALILSAPTSEKASSSSSGASTCSASASRLALTVKDVDPDRLQGAIGKLLVQWDVPIDKGTPTATVAALAAAQVQGEPVAQVLLAKAAANRLDSRRLSRPQVVSALRLWHNFAVTVLSYDPECTLPPTVGQDVEAFIGVFRNPDTAANYLSHLRWSCDHLGLCKAWDTDTVRATLKGARRRKVRLFGGPSGAKHLLTKELFQRLVTAADAAGMADTAMLCLVAWHFLLRVQSEGMPMQVGAPADSQGIGPDRHSGIWLESDSCAVLRLRIRKNRPQGSLLRRHCTCRTTSRQFCLPHRLGPFLRGKKYMQQLWPSATHAMLAGIRKLLAALGVDSPNEYTFKMFRAGHATSLASEGKSLGYILNAGEWKSTAVLSYIDEDTVDASQFLELVLADSDID